MKSIQRRLGLGLVLSLVLVGVALQQGSLWLLESSIRENLRRHLEEEAEGLVAALTSDATGLQLDNSRVNPRYRRAFSGSYFRIQLPDHTRRSRSLWDYSPEWPETLGLSQDLIQGPQNQHLLSYRDVYRKAGQSLTIDVAQDYSPVLESIRHIQLISSLLMGCALLALLLLQRYAMKTALRPLEHARQQILQLQEGKRHQLDPEAPEELQPLVQQINHLLAHTESSLKRSRNALGNLGHALKTPLAVLSALLEQDELKTQPELQRSLKEQVNQIEQRVALELNRARLASDALPGHYFQCSDELPNLMRTLHMIHGQQLQLDWQAPPNCLLPRDREDTLELLGNVLDNACKWAKQQVTLSIQPCLQGYRIQVDDDGPGIPAELRSQALARGQRLDERPNGHGLGMDIIGDIVHAWQGTWILEDSPLGGLRVQIEFPLKPNLTQT